MKKLIALTLIIVCIVTQADAQIVPKRDKVRLGLRIGVGFTTLRGGELENPVSKRGFVTGAYSRFRLTPSLDLSTGIEASFRGAKFNNGDTGYSQIALVYSDLPVLFMISTADQGRFRTVVGYQASALLKSSLFVANDPVFRKLGLPLRQMDHMAVFGFTIDGEVTGFNFYVKYGLRDINRGIDYDDITPKQGKGSDIRNLAFEIAINF